MALALLSAAWAAPASAGTWATLTAPQTGWDRPFLLQYDAVGTVYAITQATAGPTSLFVRPAAGGDFAPSGPPIAGNGPTVMAPSDNSGRVHFVAGRATDIKYRRRGSGGNFAGAGMGASGESDIGNGASPVIGVNGPFGHAIAAWPDATASNALTVKLGVPGAFPFATADTLTGTPTADSVVGAAVVDDPSGGLG
jgi:hypothetical protein